MGHPGDEYPSEAQVKEERQDKVLIDLAGAILTMPHGFSLHKANTGQWQVWCDGELFATPQSVREIIEALDVEII